TETGLKINEGWGLWTMSGGGDSPEQSPSENWHATISGKEERDDGYGMGGVDMWSGIIKGNKWSISGEVGGKMAGVTVYCDYNSDEYGQLGIFEGSFTGTHDPSSWQALGGGIWVESDLANQIRGEGKAISGIDADINIGEIEGMEDGGSFTDDSGDITLNSFRGITLNFTGEKEGLWGALIGGIYNAYDGPAYGTWTLYDMTGMITAAENSEVGGSWLGGITGTTWSYNEIGGSLDAIWIVLHKDGTLSGRIMNGETSGHYVDVDEESGTGTWRTATVGEWIEVNPNLIDGPGLDANVIALGQAANIPITVAYSSVMSGSNGSILSVAMDTHLFNMAGGGDGIWAAIINGYYSVAAPPTADWNVTLANGEDNATLSGGAWSNGQWSAGVSGTVDGNSITGQAAGAYGDGTFSGAGTGAFERESQ
ncbi:MAG: hypothetical protein Q8R48_04040, partial [Candidatus Omnitrophota bacterium]|nr:hypothetical protein [Candidatus Omnitrophota bacterium]